MTVTTTLGSAATLAHTGFGRARWTSNRGAGRGVLYHEVCREDGGWLSGHAVGYELAQVVAAGEPAAPLLVVESGVPGMDQHGEPPSGRSWCASSRRWTSASGLSSSR